MHCLCDDQFTMELAATESGNLPKCYSMDMSQDFVPLSVFSESSQGNTISVAFFGDINDADIFIWVVKLLFVNC